MIESECGQFLLWMKSVCLCLLNDDFNLMKIKLFKIRLRSFVGKDNLNYLDDSLV